MACRDARVPECESGERQTEVTLELVDDSLGVGAHAGVSSIGAGKLRTLPSRPPVTGSGGIAADASNPTRGTLRPSTGRSSGAMPEV